MGIPVRITNPEIIQWYNNENADRAALQTQTLLLTALQVAQLAIYYALWDDAIDNRDRVIDKQKEVLDWLHNTDLVVDYPMMLKKQDVLDLPLPVVDLCADSVLFHEETHNDGQAIDDMCMHLAEKHCDPVPAEWKNHEGDFYAARATDYNGAILGQAAKRRRERFIENKTALVLRAQSTSRMNINPILANYVQAIAIHEGLASTFLEGFNSAGAGLGVNLARLGQMDTQNTNTGTGTSP